ncbi:beta strand repeat-containing protein [Dysgonomonas macrotermitis]|uniref:Uncharacterized protein n=1 Tax=Dysgonomonas macrotermitis TaxID=1346286 RepID=A0A1M5HKK2_9BACT|nr:hypothetical protein [Dysgonomonas macrotermitis]SHG16465.1 hypothetical protein SAMN05444362_11694 [Dysgonomonas macrotermitis]
MKKYYIILLYFSGIVTLHAQVGINTETPKTTLHIIPSKTDATTAEGIIAPNLTRAQLISKDARYGTDQNGAIIYITAINGTVSTKTAKITEIGYYYFDGSLWQPFSSSTPVVPTEPWRVQGSTTEATANTQNIYQAGKVVIGAAQTGTAATETLYVSGTSNITGNSKVGSSTVSGNETVGGTLAVTGATTLSGTLGVAGATTIASTGSFTLAGNGAAANKYLMSDASGKGTWTTLPATATNAEPWLVQGGTTQATANTQNIYQAGKVVIGAAQTGTAATETLYVSGTSNITGNSKVGSSTVTGNQTIGGTLAVTGATSIATTGSFTLAGNGAAAGKYLVSDASGKGTWTTLPTYPTVPTEPWQVQGGTTAATTNAQNIYQTGSVGIGASTAVPAAYKFQVTGASNVTGNSRVASSTVVGAQTVGTTLGVTGATTLSSTLGVAGATTIASTGSFTLAGNGAAASRYLMSDASGKGTWTALPTTATTEPWLVQGGTTLATTNAQNIYQTGSVSIGSNTAGTYKFQVTGASNITGNSRVASSTVVGAQTVGTTLGVTGATTLASTLGVTGVATMSNNLLVTGNTGMGITAPTQKLHVVGNEYVSGLGKFGGATTLNASAQLELGDTNKGLLPNRVALTSATVKAPVTNAVDGMIVYNTATVSAQGLSPGFYYWRGTTWTRLVDVIPQTTVNLLNLRSGVTSTVGDVTTLATKGVVLPFGDLVSTGVYAITLPEDGSYAFNFRLYGPIKEDGGNVKTARTVIFYIGLLNNSVLSDAAEINVNVIPSTNISTVATYSVVLACDGKAGDRITFRLHHFSITPYPWSLSASSSNSQANRTSMVWWKL